MALPDISLAEFNRIASGKYNAGLVDFATGQNGDVSLAKVNSHIHSTGKNKVALSAERIVQVKEAFLNALERGGVGREALGQIRESLGLPEEISATGESAKLKKIHDRRFSPLTRAGVRQILDTYANGGRGFTAESQAAVTAKDAQKAEEARNASQRRVVKRKIANAITAHNLYYPRDFAMTDALSILALRPLAAFKEVRDMRYKGVNAANERSISDAALRNDFKNLFVQTVRLLAPGKTGSAPFQLGGMAAKIEKGEDGRLVATVGAGKSNAKVPLELTAEEFLQRMIGRAVADREVLGGALVKNLLGEVYDHDLENGILASDRTSLTRHFAAFILEHQAEDAWGQLVNGDYNTGTLVEIAERALDGSDEADTKAKLDAYHAKLLQENASLPPEMKAMLENVAGIPLEKGAEKGSEFMVRRPIVADIAQAVEAIPPPPPAGAQPLAPREIGGLEGLKNFVADLVFSDDTMVGDVVVDRPGEKMRKWLSSDEKILALAAIFKNPAVLDNAFAPQILAAVKEGFAKMAAALDESFAAANNGLAIAQAAGRPDFPQLLASLLRDPEKLPGAALAKFDAIVQTMANKGCEAIQGFINGVFKVDLANVNEAGALTTDPYKNKSPDEIKALLKGKNLNQILDAASNSDAPGQVGFFRQIISTYFTQLGKADKRSAFASAMRYADVFDFAGKEGEARESAMKAAINKFTGAVLKGSSPLLQKMLQGLPKDVVGDYADALADMKTHLAPIPRKVVQAHLMKMIDDSNGKIVSIELEKSLGAASVGEAFLCRFGVKTRQKKYEYTENANGQWTRHEVKNGRGEQVYEDVVEYKNYVVKIMRHDAEKRVRAEAEIFTEAAKKIPGMEKTWEGQLKQYMTEFDFTNEAKNVEEGVKLYDVKGTAGHHLKAIAPKVTSMKLAKIVPPQKNAMVLEVAEGKTVDDFFKIQVEQIREAVSAVFEKDPATGRIKWEKQVVDGKTVDKPVFKANIPPMAVTNLQNWLTINYGNLQSASDKILQAVKAWFHEAILGSGKFHGDTHAGNLMVDTGVITFIDFGNLYKLEAARPDGVNEKTELLRVIIGAAFRNPSFILQGFEKLMSAGGRAALAANRAKAMAILSTVLDKSKGGFSFNIVYRLQAAVSELQKLGLELPPQINCFIQSMVRLSNTVTEINTIMNQSKALVEAAKTITAPAPVRDELDLVGQAFDIFASEDGKKLEPYESDPIFDEPARDEDGNVIPYPDVPHYINAINEDRFGGRFKSSSPLFQANGAYTNQVKSRIAGAADPVAEAGRLLEMFEKHCDREHNFDMAQVLGHLDKWLADFKSAYASAATDQARAGAIATFAAHFAKAQVTALQVASQGFKSANEAKFKEPSTFASAITGILLNKFDALQATLTGPEKAALLVSAGGIAYQELNVGFWDLKNEDIVVGAMLEDARKTGGEKDYKVDIGV